MCKHEMNELLNTRYPVIQAPMLGVSTPEMAAAVSNAGDLGSLPVGGLSPDATRDLIRRTKGLTGKPFAVNLFAHDVPEVDDAWLQPMREFLLRLSAREGYDVDSVALSEFKHYYTNLRAGQNAGPNLARTSAGILEVLIRDYEHLLKSGPDS